MTNLPLPGQAAPADLGTVVASVWLDDEAEKPFALLLILRPAPPYYLVQNIELADGSWKPYAAASLHPNIVPAVEDYQQQGGDY